MLMILSTWTLGSQRRRRKWKRSISMERWRNLLKWMLEVYLDPHVPRRSLAQCTSAHKHFKMDWFGGDIYCRKSLIITELFDFSQVPYAKNYEPYFIIRKGSCPLYDERFGGYGWNKVSQIIQLKMMKWIKPSCFYRIKQNTCFSYTFTVSPTGFMMHINHEASTSLHRWRRDSNYRRCLHELKSSFIADTKKEFKREMKEWKKHHKHFWEQVF